MQGARVLAVFATAERAEEAVKDLRRAGFDATRLSVIGKGDDSFWTRLGAALTGVAVLSVPRIGHVVAVGPIIAPPTGKAARHTLTAMLMRAGISAGAARTYEAAVRGGQIVVLVHGAAKDVLRARGLLRAERPESLKRKEITS